MAQVCTSVCMAHENILHVHHSYLKMRAVPVSSKPDEDSCSTVSPEVSFLFGLTDQPVPWLHLSVQTIYWTNMLEIMNSN